VLGSTFGGNDCWAQIGNFTYNDLQAIGSSKWDTDSWYQGIPPNSVLHFDGHLSWESDGGLFRGCSNSAVWQVVPAPNSDASGTIALTTTYPWDGNPTYTCTPSNPVVHCTQAGGGALPAGQVAWNVSQD
jgi:hypothetical protein